MEAFVYCWFDNLTKKKYIGYHRGTEDDGYVCSSKSMLKNYQERPLDFTREILKYGTEDEMRAYEIQLLTELDAAHSAEYYNLNNGGYHIVFTPEVRDKMSKARIGVEPANKGVYGVVKQSKESNAKRSKTMRGKKKTPETIERMKEAQRKRDNTNRPRGWKQSEKQKRAASLALSKTSKCPQCGKEGKHGNMIRWHYDNCKIRKV